MTHLRITTAVSVALVAALVTSHAAQAQNNQRNHVKANVSGNNNPGQSRPVGDRPTHTNPGHTNPGRTKPGHAKPDHTGPGNSRPHAKPRIDWKKLWTNPKAKELAVPGFDGTCRTSADAKIEATDIGIANLGTEMHGVSCRVSLDEPGSSYQISVLTDHSASESFECAAGPQKASRSYARHEPLVVETPESELEESDGTDRDEWRFTASRRLKTVAVRCRVPAGGVVREVTLTDCRIGTCATDGS